MRYSYEPVPEGIGDDLAVYLSRQLYNIANSMDASFVMPVLNELPDRRIEGGLVYIKEDGVYACVSTTKDGDVEWKKLVLQDP
jgi:hypothetical protein